MIVSFDLDNTLIPYSDEFETEKMSLIQKIAGVEPLRKGTISLFKELKKNKCDIWIYTTSYRSVFQLKKTFYSYGLFPVQFINQKINAEKLRAFNCSASKNPKLFGIDIHVDDSPGVAIEGENFGFNTIIIYPDNKNWIEQIFVEIEQKKKQKTT